MRFSTIVSGLLACALGVAASPRPRSTPGTDTELNPPSHSLLEWTQPEYLPELVPAFQAKIDWDLDNNHTIETPNGLRCSWWAREGHWYDSHGRQFGEILRANDDGIVTPGTEPGTRFLELIIFYVVLLDDGHWAYVKHTGGAVVRQYQNGIVRVETDSEKYSWLNRVDFVAPGAFNGTEVMTVNHYFPNGHNLPNGLPPNHGTC
ncbi:hypothetical protein SODALDRAFT_332664 [Sodiomyces alkalinus F11]|uniref:Uncharacterized protein n=1 Tax=Sodiomyces alkalinus (strain CBS 110278 / VKM F-3762 / F11) TaxID=1314773 RepID=A0A3N2PXH3_SODAK|nr:hypothetical protein SODALDRAFT_332664 [Sodiomyces alkalinus F11]ROT39229.1 hypothetical protein SODALDRAFT_332664 [Sodiomyces alkalinus F11]